MNTHALACHVLVKTFDRTRALEGLDLTVEAGTVIPNPATTMTRVLSLIPFFTPLVMMARVNVLMPPLWEVWLGIALLAASSVPRAGWPRRSSPTRC